MPIAGLFSGIGGFEVAFAQAGYQAKLLAEIDPAAQLVLKEHFPDVAHFGDVASIEALPSDTEILTAGFPCQNLSMAGDKTGIRGSKSTVVERMFELIEKSHVPTVVIENVYFLLQLDRGNGMRWLVEQFERLNYSWAYRVLDSMGFGLPQRRRRVYLVASRKLDPRDVLLADEAVAPQPPERTLRQPLGFYWTEGRSGIGLTVDGIPPLKVGSSLGIPSAPAVLFPDGEVLMPSLSACERLQGFARGWTHASTQHPGRRAEWRLVGNAVSVPVAHWVAQRLKSPGKHREFAETPIREGKMWPDAGWNVGQGRVGAVASDRPITAPQKSISDFRDGTWTRLSDRALDGFIKRAEEGGLWVPEGFLEALRSAARKIPRAA
ncbi:DNA (cytosine-5)-methyltransferase 1 [Bradyrhizobium sp. USDA 3686]|uniref:DNA cytosine methyltransferase n=1 Tax=Bradyrhizobium TaxID=374 RepID=UPI001957867C|nr:DNA (cytosine-5-)-methyltransferase [Bradyrhizobium canariense]MBM7487717.1 DNA (cytosine-5)-methyltransferase 1 [Bradyrhizobium canariense]UFW71476.1 DNA (cytosine-5-)-methyltransferase [Bradyrhizobium canariense]